MRCFDLIVDTYIMQILNEVKNKQDKENYKIENIINFKILKSQTLFTKFLNKVFFNL